MNNLKLYLENNKNKINFITIAGDNYYPLKNKDKEIKTKIFNNDDFISGFDCLIKNSNNIQKYIIYGNHDIEDKLNDKECFLLLEQNKYNNNNIIFFNDIIEIHNNNTLIIMIETTLYDMKLDENINNTCYKMLFKSFNEIFNKSNDKKIIDLINYQNILIIDKIKNNIMKKIVIIGHHPIITSKYKNNNVNTNILSELLKLFENISYLNLYNITYLCADTHLYENSIIQIDKLYINQYIVGTGGAELDDICYNDKIYNCKSILYFKYNNNEKKYINEKVNSNISYKIEKQIKSNGFIKVNCNENNIKIDYILNNNQSGGNNNYFNKYQKYKIKYNNLLKN